jgi:hypothetical protein
VADFQDLQLRAATKVINLVDTVGHNHLVKGASIDALDGVTTENAVGNQGINLRCALLLEQFGGASDRIRGISQIVNQNGYPIANITDQHHGGILAVCDLGGAALLQNR